MVAYLILFTCLQVHVIATELQQKPTCQAKQTPRPVWACQKYVFLILGRSNNIGRKQYRALSLLAHRKSLPFGV